MANVKQTGLDMNLVKDLLNGATFRAFVSPDNSRLIELGVLRNNGVQVVDIWTDSNNATIFGASSSDFTAEGLGAESVTTVWNGWHPTTSEATSDANDVNELLRIAQEFAASQNNDE